MPCRDAFKRILDTDKGQGDHNKVFNKSKQALTYKQMKWVAKWNDIIKIVDVPSTHRGFVKCTCFNFS